MASPEGPAKTLPVTLRALRYRNFQLFFGGQLISLIGTWMQNVAQAWLVYRLTGSSVLLGLVSFSSQIPVFLMAPVGGIVADRFRRQRIVIATQTASMLLALICPRSRLRDTVQIWHIFVLSRAAGSRKRIRYSGAPGVLRGNGGPRRSDQRHRAEFLHVQCLAHNRPGGGRHSGGQPSAKAGASSPMARVTSR